MSEINDRIKELRLKMNMSQEEFGRRIGLSKSGISNIESGARGIRERHIKLICSTFNVNESWLKTGEDSINKLSISSKKIDSFSKFLKSIGYKITIEIPDESVTGHWEITEDDDKNIEEAWVVDNETPTITITKDKLSISFSEEGFQNFMASVENSVAFELFKANQNK